MSMSVLMSSTSARIVARMLIEPTCLGSNSSTLIPRLHDGLEGIHVRGMERAYTRHQFHSPARYGTADDRPKARSPSWRCIRQRWR